MDLQVFHLIKNSNHLFGRAAYKYAELPYFFERYLSIFSTKVPVFVNVYGNQESIPPGWESIPGLLKRFTNAASANYFILIHFCQAIGLLL